MSWGTKAWLIAGAAYVTLGVLDYLFWSAPDHVMNCIISLLAALTYLADRIEERLR